jgi:hypothetical protein
MYKPFDISRPNGQALQQVLTQLGLTALRMEGEIVKPLQVRAMRERRQREYSKLAYKFLCDNLDWHYLHDALDTSTIPVEALADEIATDFHKMTARDKYRDHLWQWVKSQEIHFQTGDYNADCSQCFDTGADFHQYARTGATHDLHNPTPCTRCTKGTQ